MLNKCMGHVCDYLLPMIHCREDLYWIKEYGMDIKEVEYA